MRKGLIGVAGAALMAVLATAASAAPVVFSGGGLFTRSVGSLAPTGTAGVNSPFSFRFTFDLDDAVPVRSDATSATYQLPITDFEATLGTYAFQPRTGVAALNLSQGFAFFGQPFSEPSRLFSFSIAGSAGADAPFDLGSGPRNDSLSITAIYRDSDPARPVSLADVKDPAGTPLNSVSYFGSTGVAPPAFGSLTGIFSGGFAAAGVPEPATWGMMILGFGAIGGALRRRAGAKLAFAA